MCKYQNSQILLYAFVKFSGLYIKPDKTFGGMSYEQLWLAFVMHEKYNKTWVDNC